MNGQTQSLVSVPQSPGAEPDIGMVRVTPHLAGLWLKNNHVNRRLNRGRVKKFARDMKGGRWIQNPSDLVCFGINGALLNGQHRLNAIVEAGVPVDLYIARNVDPEAQIIMDKGAPRRVSDNLHMFYGVPRKYAAKTAAIARYILAFELGIWDAPNEQDALDIWNRYGDQITWLYKSAEDLPWVRGAYYSSPVVFAAKQEPDLTARFHRALANVRPHADKNTLAAIYKHLDTPKLRTGGMKGFDMALRIFNAMAAFFEDRDITRIYVSTVGLDTLKRRWGMNRKPNAPGCSYSTARKFALCPCDPVDDTGMCWIHKRYVSKKNTANDK